MPKKSKAPTKKPVKADVAAVRRRAKSPRPKPQSARSVASRGGGGEVAPKNDSPPRQHATFEQAKGAAVDDLIHAIEEAEQRLSAVKRAHSFDELSQVSSIKFG